MSHWRELDFRIKSLQQIIQGLENSINFLKSKLNEEVYYDGLWFMEESEPIYGLAFIAFQNYINGSIKDFYETTETKIEHYRLGFKPKGFQKTNIELIIVLANFIKHKDDGLNNGTLKLLKSFNLTEYRSIDKSPIFEGLNILDQNWNLSNILEIVIQWRKLLSEKHNHSLQQQQEL